MINNLKNINLSTQFENIKEAGNYFDSLDNEVFLEIFSFAFKDNVCLSSNLDFYPTMMGKIIVLMGNQKLDINLLIENKEFTSSIKSIHNMKSDPNIKKLMQYNDQFFIKLCTKFKTVAGKFKVEIESDLIKVTAKNKNQNALNNLFNLLEAFGKMSSKKVSIELEDCTFETIEFPKRIISAEVYSCSNLTSIRFASSLKNLSLAYCENLIEIDCRSSLLNKVKICNCSNLNLSSILKVFKNQFDNDIVLGIRRLKKIIEINENQISNDSYLRAMISELGIHYVLNNVDKFFDLINGLIHVKKNEFYLNFIDILMEEDFDLFLENIQKLQVRDFYKNLEECCKNNKNFSIWKELCYLELNKDKVSIDHHEELEAPQQEKEATDTLMKKLESAKGFIHNLLKNANFYNQSQPNYIDPFKIKLDGELMEFDNIDPFKIKPAGTKVKFEVDPIPNAHQTFIERKSRGGIQDLFTRSSYNNEVGNHLKFLLCEFYDAAQKYDNPAGVVKKLVNLGLTTTFFCEDRAVVELEDVNKSLGYYIKNNDTTLDKMFSDWLELYKEGVLSALTLKYTHLFSKLHELHFQTFLSKMMKGRFSVPKNLNVLIRDFSFNEYRPKYDEELVGNRSGRDTIALKEIQDPRNLNLKDIEIKNASLREEISQEMLSYFKIPFLAKHFQDKINEMIEEDPKKCHYILDILSEHVEKLLPPQKEKMEDQVKCGIRFIQNEILESKMRIAILEKNQQKIDQYKIKFSDKSNGNNKKNNLLLERLRNEYRQDERDEPSTIQQINLINESLKVLKKALKDPVSFQKIIIEKGHLDYYTEQRFSRLEAINLWIKEKQLIIEDKDDKINITFHGVMFLFNEMGYLNEATKNQKNEYNNEEMQVANVILDLFKDYKEVFVKLEPANLKTLYPFFISKTINPLLVRKVLTSPYFLDKMFSEMGLDFFAANLNNLIKLFALLKDESHEFIYTEIMLMLIDKNLGAALEDPFLLREHWGMIQTNSTYFKKSPLWDKIATFDIDWSKFKTDAISIKKDQILERTPPDAFRQFTIEILNKVDFIDPDLPNYVNAKTLKYTEESNSNTLEKQIRKGFKRLIEVSSDSLEINVKLKKIIELARENIGLSEILKIVVELGLYSSHAQEADLNRHLVTLFQKLMCASLEITIKKINFDDFHSEYYVDLEKITFYKNNLKRKNPNKEPSATNEINPKKIKKKILKGFEKIFAEAQSDCIVNDQLQKLISLTKRKEERALVYKEIVDLGLVSDQDCKTGIRTQLLLANELLASELKVQGIEDLLFKLMEKYKEGVIFAVSSKFNTKILGTTHKFLEVHLMNRVARCMSKGFTLPQHMSFDLEDASINNFIEATFHSDNHWDAQITDEINSYFAYPLLIKHFKDKINERIESNYEEFCMYSDFFKESAETRATEAFNASLKDTPEYSLAIELSELNGGISARKFNNGKKIIEQKIVDNHIRLALLKNEGPACKEYREGKNSRRFIELARETAEMKTHLREETAAFIESQIREVILNVNVAEMHAFAMGPHKDQFHKIKKEIMGANLQKKRKAEDDVIDEPNAKRKKNEEQVQMRGVKRKADSDIDQDLKIKRPKSEGEIQDEIEKELTKDLNILEDPLKHSEAISLVGHDEAYSTFRNDQNAALQTYLESQNYYTDEDIPKITFEGIFMIFKEKGLLKKR